MKKAIVIFLFFTMLLPSCATNEKESNICHCSLLLEKDSITYISLGDSIAQGYALENMEEERFSALVAGLFEGIGKACKEKNYARKSLTSENLIDLLTSQSAPDLSQADLITVSVGANDVLVCALDFIYNSFFPGSDTTALYEAMTKRADAAVGEFRTNLSKIISLLRKKAPQAKTVFLTIYNPYEHVSAAVPSGDKSLFVRDIAENYVSKINAVIKELCEKECAVADIYAAFKNSDEKLVNAGADSGSILPSYDPHPNKAGHIVIANEIFQLISRKDDTKCTQ